MISIVCNIFHFFTILKLNSDLRFLESLDLIFYNNAGYKRQPLKLLETVSVIRIKSA